MTIRPVRLGPATFAQMEALAQKRLDEQGYCSKFVHNTGSRSVGFHRCTRKGVLEHEGKKFCRLHHPPSIEKREAAELRCASSDGCSVRVQKKGQLCRFHSSVAPFRRLEALQKFRKEVERYVKGLRENRNRDVVEDLVTFEKMLARSYKVKL